MNAEETAAQLRGLLSVPGRVSEVSTLALSATPQQAPSRYALRSTTHGSVAAVGATEGVTVGALPETSIESMA